MAGGWVSVSSDRVSLQSSSPRPPANIAAHAGQGEIVLIPLAIWKRLRHRRVWRWIMAKVSPTWAVRSRMDIRQPAQPGQGLGAMSRLAAALQIYSRTSGGTALFARVVQESATADQTSDSYAVGAVSLAMNGERECGDAWSADFTPDRSIYIVADGLGHGPSAAEAAREAVRVFRQRRTFRRCAF